MNVVASTQPGRAAPIRLLEHCASLDVVEHPRTPARERLEEAVGAELAQMLLRALAGDNRVRSDLAV